MKKQTVWLLTMLSLMVVLSVYYVISPNSGELAYIDQKVVGEIEETNSSPTESTEEGLDDISIDEIKNDELFTTIRMEIQDERSRKEDRLNDVVASSKASTDEKNEALETIELLEQTTTKEVILQDTIMSANEEYEDVLVRSDDEKIHIHIKTNELSNDEVLQIMQMARDEFGNKTVDVNFQPVEK